MSSWLSKYKHVILHVLQVWISKFDLQTWMVCTLKLSAIMRSDAPNLAITQPKSNDNLQKSILHLYQRATEIKHRKKEKEKSKPLTFVDKKIIVWIKIEKGVSQILAWTWTFSSWLVRLFYCPYNNAYQSRLHCPFLSLHSETIITNTFNKFNLDTLFYTLFFC